MTNLLVEYAIRAEDHIPNWRVVVCRVRTLRTQSCLPLLGLPKLDDYDYEIGENLAPVNASDIDYAIMFSLIKLKKSGIRDVLVEYHWKIDRAKQRYFDCRKVGLEETCRRS